MLALVCLVLLRIDTEQGIYIKRPRSTTQILLSLQLSCQASTTTCSHTYSTYCLYLTLASLSRDCIKLNPKYCIDFTFKPHQSLFLHPMSHYYRSCLSHAGCRTACVGYVSVCCITRYLNNLT